MIEKIPFGRTGHLSTRTLFGAFAVGRTTQAIADQVRKMPYYSTFTHVTTPPAAELAAKLAELEALLVAHDAEQAESLWPSVLDTPQRVDKHGGEPFNSNDEYIYWPN